MRTLRAALPSALTGTPAERYRTAVLQLTQAGLPTSLCATLAELRVLDNALDILECASTLRRAVGETAKTWFVVTSALKLDWLEDQITGLAVDSALQATARIGLRESSRSLERMIVGRVISSGGLERWQATRESALGEWERTVTEIASHGASDFASLSVCLDALRPLAD
jgi:NAD-specific glutamate dehydrogenase